MTDTIEYRITYTYSEYVEYDEAGYESIDPDYIYEKYIEAENPEQAARLFEELMGYDLTVELVDIEVEYMPGEEV